ncbi:zinc ribbon domain-containing protein [Aneurinibacillus tyrosinisolvens]|uniref:zinc ribbon domain-containing protein n=1 Tax=Aneurinibacillus tyrosinisolvens TaxID=1443435 RepID=UPI00063EEBB6|nr:zinc ribbon domain-containing protein [Aneurinibacillus tyrosinisolvens]
MPAEPTTKKERTPSFVATLKLMTTKHVKKQLSVLSDCGRQLYNAVLGESIKRLNGMRNSRQYQDALHMPKKTTEQKKERDAVFKQVRETYGFTDTGLQKWGTQCKNDSNFIGEKLGTHVCQKLSTRAFRAVEKVAFGKASRVHFKPKGDFVSLEGKNNETFLRYSNGYALIGDLTVQCRINKKDQWLAHALHCRIKYCRLIHKKIKGKDEFYLQLIVEGFPYQKVKLGKEETGIDVGPSSIAIVSDTQAQLLGFCENLPFIQEEKRILQRKMERQRRANNPQNYHQNGTVKKGKKTWIQSNRYKKTKEEVAELERRLAAERYRSHGETINHMVAHSKSVKGEKLSYKAFQKRFGKSVNRCAPGQFMKRLSTRITVLGGKFREFPTYSTKLSQTCHCGIIKKKKLSQRWHQCECGVMAQRDLYSAYLAKFVTTKNTVSLTQAKKQWSLIEPILTSGIKALKNEKKHRKVPSSFGI